MKYLLDTNIIIWYSEDNEMLPLEIKEIIQDDFHELYVSTASLWEISLKYALNKLKLGMSLSDFISMLTEKYDFKILPIEIEHILFQSKLPFYHRDPFDRLIFSQSVVEKIEFLFTDEIFKQYLNVS